ncbi:hypothetical protein ARMSODRAFT_947586 [Armillaria solidipes]|uniref:Ricin B lectin domain-containing protein n=1 Tax=Armillaria solidipes TaxID=1076256 RepID=A0A2H3CTJ4_9AGAR|nr:hypothetical protein ARMSODRAFT_947586 [Armillaria solidipes]
MLKLLCFISLAVVSVSANLSPGTYHIFNYNENALKLSSSQVVGGSDSSGQLWQLTKPFPMPTSTVYAIMPILSDPNLTGSLMTFNNTGIFLSETGRGLQFVLNTSLFR